MAGIETPARRFLSGHFNPASWNEIEPLFAGLAARETATAGELEAWLLDMSELLAALDEEGCKRALAKDLNTGDEAARQAYCQWIDDIEPRVKPWEHKLNIKLANHPRVSHLPPGEFRVLLKRVRTMVEIYRDANVPLQTECDKLGMDYDGVIGAQTVEFDGAERTLTQMLRYLRVQDRATRERAWRLIHERRGRDYERLEGVYDKLLGLRQRMAGNAGLEGFRDLRWRQMSRFDYTPDDCKRFNAAIAKVWAPRLARQQEERKAALGVKSLRPWDLDVDPLGRAPLEPFADTDTLVKKTRATFERVDPVLASHFSVLDGNRMLHLDNRKGKAPGAYQLSFQERRLPFIFMNATGRHDDVDTLLHESGHAFHFLEMRGQRHVGNRSAPMEFCEVASMSMELIGGTFLGDTFYDRAGAVRARVEHLEGIITFLPWMATIDAFQHWIYENPGHSHEERADFWLGLRASYGGQADWSGLEPHNAKGWIRQLHLFHYPFYYVEYGIAQLGALQIWRNYLADPARAIRDYRRALSLGYTRSLPELFEAAGITFDFSEEMLGELLEFVDSQLGALKRKDRENSGRLVRA